MNKCKHDWRFAQMFYGEPVRIDILKRIESKATALFYCTKCLAHANITDRQIVYTYPKVNK